MTINITKKKFLALIIGIPSVCVATVISAMIILPKVKEHTLQKCAMQDAESYLKEHTVNGITISSIDHNTVAVKKFSDYEYGVSGEDANGYNKWGILLKIDSDDYTEYTYVLGTAFLTDKGIKEEQKETESQWENDSAGQEYLNNYEQGMASGYYGKSEESSSATS